MRLSNARWVLLAACFLLSSVAAFAATPDGDRLWTTVGSAGTLDEDSVGKVFFHHGRVQKGTPAPPVNPASRQPQTEGESVEVPDSAVIRYNVTAVDGLFGQNDIGMKVRFRDEGKGARVLAQLIEVDLETGAEVTLLTFDSDNALVEATGYRTLEVFTCGGKAEPFDFVNKAYYIEATLTTNTFPEGGMAGIEIIQLRATTCGGGKF